MIHPIIDEYYNYSAAYERSSGFAVSKGLGGGKLGGKEGEEKLRVVTQGVGGVEVSDSESG